MDNKLNNQVITETTNEIDTSLNDAKEVDFLTSSWLEKKVLQVITPLSLEQITSISEQIENHYVASVVYNELQKNLTEREKIVTEFKNKLVETHSKAKVFAEEQKILNVKIDKLVNRQKQYLKEYQEGVQELEEEVSEIDKQTIELEKQIIELQRRKSEIAEQQEVRLKEQDTTQLELQSEVDTLEKDVAVLEKQHNDFQEQIKTMSPEGLIALDNRIEDLVHHICSIFEVSLSTDLTNKQTENNPAPPPIFQIDPWATEENQGLAQIFIPVGVKHIILSLHTPGDKVFERYSAELYSSNGRRVWNSDKLDTNGRAIVITFNSTFFLSDDYELRLRGRNSERNYTPIAEYYFHVNKK